MNRFLRRILCVFMGVLCGMSLSVHATTRIMCLGDSITQGYNDGNGNGYDRSYRYDFWKLLIDNNHDFDLVGGRAFPASKWGDGITISPSAADLAAMYPDYTGKSFDGDHEAAWGNTTFSFINGDGKGLAPFSDRLAALSTSGKPDIVLLHLGSNDPKYVTATQTRDKFTEIIGEIRAVNPNVRIMLAQLIPRLDSTLYTDGVTAINNVIPALATSLNTVNSPVTVVDFCTALTASDLRDKVHPNLSGEAKMAAHWYVAVSNYVNRLGGVVNGAPTAIITVDET